MSGKKATKKNLATSAQAEAPPRRPTTLGMIILIAGGVSTWYWYKPLPPETIHGSYSDWTRAESEGLWSNTDLIRPTLDSLDAEFPHAKETAVDGLIADSKKLLPVPVYRKNLNELLIGELPPNLPAASDFPAVQVATPKVWTNSSEDPATKSFQEPASSSNYLSNRSHQARSLDWPDQNYEPARQPSVQPPVVANSAPSLLPTSTGAALRAIRTNEDIYGNSPLASEIGHPISIQNRSTIPESNSAVQGIGGAPTTGAPRTPQIIRQPKR